MLIPLIQRATLRHSQITYRPDVTQVGSDEIPLGVIADLRVGDIYGVALRVRRELSDAEAAKVGRLMRATIARPFNLLRRDFDKVLKDRNPSDYFSSLPARNHTSLFFDALSETFVDVPKGVRGNPEYEALRAWATDALKNHIATIYWSMALPGSGGFSSQDEVQMQEAKAA